MRKVKKWIVTWYNVPSMNNEVVKIAEWISYANLIHGYSTREFGNMSLKTDHAKGVAERRHRFASSLGISLADVVFLPLTHSNNVLLIEDKRHIKTAANSIYSSGGRLLNDGDKFSPIYCRSEWQAGIDGVIVAAPNIFPVMLTGDCASLGFYCPNNRVIGLAHVGMISAFNKLPEKMVYLMNKYCGCYPKDIEVVIYPSIRGCHYYLNNSGVWKSIGQTVRDYYGKQNSFYENDFLDLQGFITDRLVSSGIQLPNIIDTNRCTVCESDVFFSNYAAQTTGRKKREGRFANILGLRSF